MAFSSYILLGAIVALVSAVIYAALTVGHRPKDYPPGPPTLPIIGNIHLIPKTKPHLQYEKWAKEYGPVYSLILGTKVMIVLSSDQAIKDLLDKRSAIYSSRPDLYLANIASGGLRMGFMKYGLTWRKLRAVCHNNLNVKAAKSYVPYQDLENKAMLLGFLRRPELFIQHIRRYTSSLTTQMIFGFRTTSLDDPKMLQLYSGFERFSELAGDESAALLDVFPLLRRLPDFLLPARRYAKRLHAEERELYIGHWLTAKKAIQAGTANPCFCVDLVKAQVNEGFSDPLAAYVSGSMLEAGSDTTAAELVGFVQAMILFPEVAQTAQKQLDSVCGNRLPTLEDQAQLPYIRSCVKECLRWMPTAILGVPHAAIRDDEYMGYKIPKGASVMWNVWTIHMDPLRHPDPRRFDPTRYMHDTQTALEAATNPNADERDHFVFGNGRRICQGMHIAERSMFLAISRLLWAFDFKPALDDAGHEIMLDADNITDGFLVQPKPFSARIVPRNPERVAVLEAEWDSARAVLDEELQWKVLPEGLIWKAYNQNVKEGR